MHLPKTAGSTLAAILANQYGPNAILSLYDSTFGEEIQQLPQVQREQVAVILGHFYFGIHAYLQEPALYVTILRDPIERVVSHYYYVRHDPAHYLYNAAKEMSLSEYVVHCNLREPNNDQTRLLAGQEFANSLGTCSPAMLSHAKQNLRNRFLAVGIAEEFDRSLILFKRMLNWRTPYYIRQNVAQDRPSTNALSPATLSTIQAYNNMDCELYRNAQDLFQEQVALQGESLEQEIRQFQRMNTLVAKLPMLLSLTHRYRLRSRFSTAGGK